MTNLQIKSRVAEFKFRIAQFAQQHGRRPSWWAKDPVERLLNKRMRSYVTPTSISYDARFREIIETIVPTLEQNPRQKKDEIVRFILRHGRRPSAAIPKEAKLARRMYRFCASTKPEHDPVFAARVERLAPTQIHPERNKIDIIKFLIWRKRFPAVRSADPRERQLGKAFSNYIHQCSNGFDPHYRDIIRDCFGREIKTMDQIQERVEHNKRAALAFCKRMGRRPLPSSPDPEEQRFAQVIDTYARKEKNDWFAQAVRAQFPVAKMAPVNKNQILDFCKLHGRRPTRESNSQKERHLYRAMARYISPSQRAYDAIFRDLLGTIAPPGKRGRPRKETK
jgi:hypothetical protein